MRIKFLHSPRMYGGVTQHSPRIHHHIPPLGLPVVTSFLRRKGFDVTQDDLDIKHYRLLSRGSRKALDLTGFEDLGRVRRALDSNDDVLLKEAEKALKMTKTRSFDAFGFSVSDEWNLPQLGISLIMARVLKERHGSIVFIGGTPFETTSDCIHKTMARNNPFIDALAIDGQFGAFNVVAEMSGMSGILGELSSNSWEPKEAEDLCPTPVFDGLPLDLYRYAPDDIPGFRRERVLILPYHYLYGCQNKCAFCANSGITVYACKDPRRIADDLEHLSMRHKTRYFFFLNSNCNPTKRFVSSLCEEIKERRLDLQWSDCANFMMLDRNILKKLREAGAVRLIFGLESASERMLRYVGKPVKTAMAERFLRISHECGIWNELEVISGLPHERWEDVLATETFLRKNRGTIDYVHHNMFHWEPGSLLSKHPGLYRLTNVRADSSGEGYAYDEVGGLNWKEKKGAVQKAHAYLEQVTDELYPGGYTASEDSFLKMFYLYGYYGDKRAVTNHLQKHPSIYGREASKDASP